MSNKKKEKCWLKFPVPWLKYILDFLRHQGNSQENKLKKNLTIACQGVAIEEKLGLLKITRSFGYRGMNHSKAVLRQTLSYLENKKFWPKSKY